MSHSISLCAQTEALICVCLSCLPISLEGHLRPAKGTPSLLPEGGRTQGGTSNICPEVVSLVVATKEVSGCPLCSKGGR